VLAAQFHTGPPNLVLLVTARAGGVDDIEADGRRLAAELAAQPGVAEAASYWSRGESPALCSENGAAALVLARVPGEVNAARARVGELAEQFTRQTATVTVEAGGQDVVFRAIGTQARTDFLSAERCIPFPRANNGQIARGALLVRRSTTTSRTATTKQVVVSTSRSTMAGLTHAGTRS
jgi:hypothetical protein